MNSIVNESTTQRQRGEGGPTNPASPSDVVAALRRHEWVRIMQEAADLIEQQAESIKELEASLASMVQGVKISAPTQTMEQEFQNHYRRGYEAGKAALRQRIDDAPVLAWLHTQSNGCSSLIRTPPSAFDPQDLADAEVSIYALISKEDLK